MISIGENRGNLYKGGFHPAELYKGSEKIAGYTLEEFSGEGTVILPDCYNDKVYDVIMDSESITLRGKNILSQSDIKIQKGYYSDSGGTLLSNSNYTALHPIKVQSGTKYRFSSNQTLYNIWFTTSKEVSGEGCISLIRSGVFTTPEICKYIKVSLKGASSNFKWAMLEKGTGDGIYEPYIEPRTVGAGEEIPTFHETTVIETDGKISGKYKKRSE